MPKKKIKATDEWAAHTLVTDDKGRPLGRVYAEDKDIHKAQVAAIAD